MDWMTLDGLIARLQMLRDADNANDLVVVDTDPILDLLYITDVERGLNGRVYITAKEVDRT